MQTTWTPRLQVADAAASKLAELRRQVLKEVDRQRSSLEATAAELGMQAEAAAAVAKGAEVAAAVAETFSLRLENSSEELMQVKVQSDEQHDDVKQRMELLVLEVKNTLGPKVSHLEEQLQAESSRLDVVASQGAAHEVAQSLCQDAVQRLSEASAASAQAWEQHKVAMQECVAEKHAASLSSCEKTSADLIALAAAVSARAEATEISIGELRMDLGREVKTCLAESADLGSRLAELDKSTRCFSEEVAEKARQATRALEMAMNPEVQEIRHELQAAAQRKSVQVLESESAKLAKALRELQCQGIGHEWTVPRANQRVEYLAMDSKDAKGIWMDSPEFWLGGQGPLFLRFYPQGVAGGDGLCAVGLYAPHQDRLAALPLRLDLRVADLRKRAVAQTEAEGVLWLAHGFGSFGALELVKEDLTVGVEIPPFAWAALDKANANQAAGNPFQHGSFTATAKLRDVSDCPKPTVSSEQVQPDCKARSVPGSPHACPGAVLSSPSPSRPGWAVFGDQGDRNASAPEQPERRRPWSAQAAQRAVNVTTFATVPAQRRKPPACANPFLSATSAADDRRSTNPFLDRA
ncbi:IFI30 [Symbiodinium pilosum]|uniref:IFI30 protein n=1 Tax=Symbiodinium pilosum TaxID=2952 RepID=A0A812NFP9_SYMPI|nr:IFI30 [Symbiodinium pilosum]